MATGPDYCKLADVQGRLYAGQGMAPGDPAPPDATRDALLESIITAASRDFDHQVEGPNYPGIFSPLYDVRVFSGRGSQTLDVDPILVATKVEINSTPGRAPSWVDYTAELGSYQMGLIEPGGIGYPKHAIFRQASFYEDPFPFGNIRVTGLWGICLPDLAMTRPQNPWMGVDPANLVPPGATGTVGWWATPDDVADAVAAWVVYRFEHAKAAYSEQPSSSTATGAQQTRYPEDIPAEVARVIARYSQEDAHHPKLALVPDGIDEPGTMPYRWAGWLTQ